MPAQVVHTVAASGGDYTSLNAWEAAQQRDLVAADEEAVAECAAFADTSSLTIDGWTVDATRRVIVRAAVGADAQMPWSTSAYRMTANNIFAIDNFEDYTLVQGLQLEQTIAFAQGGIKNRAVLMEVERCVIRSDGAGSLIGVDQTVAGEIRLRNCLIYGWATHGVACGAFSGGVVRLYNCTIVNNGQRGIHRAGDDSNNLLYVHNTLCAGNTTADFAQSITAGSHNATADGSALGANSRTSQTFTFVDAAGGDWHLDGADAGAQGFGTDLSADPTWPFSVDFDGETRSAPWDIGADQVAAGGPTHLLECLPGSLAITGVAADLAHGRLLQGQTGALALTGVNATLAHGRELVALAGALSLTGSPADLRRSRLLQAIAGSLSLAGATTTLRHGRRLEAQPGSLVLTGIPAELTYTPGAGGYVLECLPGSLSLTGTPADLRHGRALVGLAGSLTLSGDAVELRVGRELIGLPGALLLTGAPAELRLARLLQGAPGSLLLAGLPATLRWSGQLIAAPSDGPLRAVLLLEDARGRWVPVATATAAWVGPRAEATLH